MDNNKPAQNIQDSFLNTARKERASITIYLLSGVKLTGRIRSFRQVLRCPGGERSRATHLQARHLHRGYGTGGVPACGPFGPSGEVGCPERLPLRL